MILTVNGEVVALEWLITGQGHKYRGEVKILEDVKGRRYIPHGEGTAYWSEKTMIMAYSGEWVDGMWHGQGASYHRDDGRLLQEGTFACGEFISGTDYEKDRIGADRQIEEWLKEERAEKRERVFQTIKKMGNAVVKTVAEGIFDHMQDELLRKQAHDRNLDPETRKAASQQLRERERARAEERRAEEQARLQHMKAQMDSRQQ